MRLGNRLATLFLLIAAPAVAQLVPVDREIRIDSNTPRSAETAIAMEPDGSFLVVWDNLQGAGSFGCQPDSAIFGRWFDADGAPRAPRFVIATDQSLCQTDLRLVRAEDGSHLLTWSAAAGKYGGKSVEGALLPVSGHAVRIPGIQVRSARLAQFPLASGRFLMTVSQKSGVTGRLRDVAGAFLGPSFRIGGRGSFLLDVASLPGGGFAVAWTAEENGFPLVFLGRFDPAGRRLGPVLLASRGPFGYDFEQRFHLSANDRGQLALGWSYYPVSGGDVYGVAVQTFDTDGRLLASGFVDQDDVVKVNDLAFGHGGRVVATWEAYPNGDAYLTDVRAALIDPGGQVVDIVDLTDHQEGRQIFPSVANTPDGRWVTVWSGDGESSWAAWLRLFARER